MWMPTSGLCWLWRREMAWEFDRDILRDKMTPTQIAEAQKLAAEWKPKK